MRIKRFVLSFVLAVGLGACTAGQTTAPTITSVNPFTNSKLQFAVGTANLYGGLGLNVVSTMRQPNGESATLVNTPALYGPFAFTVGAAVAAGSSGCCSADPYTTVYNLGPSLPETKAKPITIISTSQAVHPGTPFCDGVGAVPAGFTSCVSGIAPNTTTFGQSGGVFAMGLAPYNTVNVTGQSYSYSPYPQPLYSTSHLDFLPWGGPPAFDPDQNGMGTRDGLIPLGSDSFGFPFFLGVGEGVTAFDGVTPATGLYTLNVQISFLNSNAQTVTGTLATQARLSSLTLLPNVTAPLVTPSGNGGATMMVTLPAGVTQAYVQIIDYGPGAGPHEAAGGGALTAANCQSHKGSSFAPVYYTIEVTASKSYALPPLSGPNTALGGASVLTPSPSLCTAAQNSAALGTASPGDNFTVQMIGFDYPAYQAAQSLEAGGNQAPAITGPGGQSDITISVPVEENPPYTAQIPLTFAHRPLVNRSGLRAMPALRASDDVYRRLGVPAPRW